MDSTNEHVNPGLERQRQLLLGLRTSGYITDDQYDIATQVSDLSDVQLLAYANQLVAANHPGNELNDETVQGFLAQDTDLYPANVAETNSFLQGETASSFSLPTVVTATMSTQHPEESLSAPIIQQGLKLVARVVSAAERGSSRFVIFQFILWLGLVDRFDLNLPVVRVVVVVLSVLIASALTRSRTVRLIL